MFALLLATCVSTSLQCGARVEATGCTRFAFQSPGVQVISATMRPLDISLNNPRLTLEVPVPGFRPPVVNGGQTATLRYVLPASRQAGTYELSMSARLSGCVRPLIVHQPDDVSVPFGSRAIVRGGDISASGGGLLFEWLDMEALPVIVGNSETLITPPVTRPQYYALRATNACGSATTRMIVVAPDNLHRRAAR